MKARVSSHSNSPGVVAEGRITAIDIIYNPEQFPGATVKKKGFLAGIFASVASGIGVATVAKVATNVILGPQWGAAVGAGVTAIEFAKEYKDAKKAGETGFFSFLKRSWKKYSLKLALNMTSAVIGADAMNNFEWTRSLAETVSDYNPFQGNESPEAPQVPEVTQMAEFSGAPETMPPAANDNVSPVVKAPELPLEGAENLNIEPEIGGEADDLMEDAAEDVIVEAEVEAVLTPAQEELTKLVESGELSPRAQEIAEAALRGEEWAVRDAGLGMMSGLYGFPEMSEHGINLLQQAAESGDAKANIDLADIQNSPYLSEKFGLVPDVEEATQIAEQPVLQEVEIVIADADEVAADSVGNTSNAEAPVEAEAVLTPEEKLADLAASGDLGPKAQELVDAALRGEKWAIRDAGLGMMNNVYGLPESTEHGVELLQQIAESGDVKANIDLAKIQSSPYLSEKFGLEYDPEAAKAKLAELQPAQPPAAQVEDVVETVAEETPVVEVTTEADVPVVEEESPAVDDEKTAAPIILESVPGNAPAVVQELTEEQKMAIESLKAIGVDTSTCKIPEDVQMGDTVKVKCAPTGVPEDVPKGNEYAAVEHAEEGIAPEIL